MQHSKKLNMNINIEIFICKMTLIAAKCNEMQKKKNLYKRPNYWKKVKVNHLKKTQNAKWQKSSN